MIKELFYKERFVFLMVCLLLYLLLVPFLADYIRLKFLMHLLMSAILFSGVYAVSEKKRTAFIAVLLALPMFFSIWFSHIIYTPYRTLMVNLFGLPFLLFMTITVLMFIFKTHQVTRDVIAASIVVYLLIGLLWGFIYAALDFLEPGSFSLGETWNLEDSSVFNYFSLVTLTTLGYGDVTPLTAKARSFAATEAVIGQMYIAVLIARLVGLHIAQAMSGKID